jgi:hypothetical protein
LYIKGDLDNPVAVIVADAKQWQTNGGVQLSDGNVNTGLPIQMSDGWINNVALRIRDKANAMADSPLKEEH